MGYFCQGNETDHSTTCDKGEVLIVDSSTSQAVCRRLLNNGELCHRGYKLQRTELGLTCRRKSIPLQCPPTFILSKRDGNLTCAPRKESVNVCKDRTFVQAFGNRVVCRRGKPSGVVLPCAEGYRVKNDGARPHCVLKECLGILCQNDGDGTVPTCVVQQERSCKQDKSGGAHSGSRKSCGEIRLEARQGCKPRCANGGRCLEGRCQCPAGVTGTACQTGDRSGWLHACLVGSL